MLPKFIVLTQDVLINHTLNSHANHICCFNPSVFTFEITFEYPVFRLLLCVSWDWLQPQAG